MSRSIGAQWTVNAELKNSLVYVIYQNYSKVFLTLTHPSLTGEVYVDMDTLRAEFSSYNDTLGQLLISLGNRSLETTDSPPDTKIRYAKYSDAIRVGYKVNLGKIGMNLPENYPDDDKHDLEITRPKYQTNIELLHTHCLISVNGYYHRTETNGVKTYVAKGGDTMRHSHNNHIGIWNFYDIGKLKQVPLKPEHIIPAVTGTKLREKILFTTEEPLEGKSVILILGGYIVLPQSEVFWLNGDQSFVLDINRIPYVQRIFESSKGLDLSELNLSSKEINPDHGFLVDEMFSDETIRRYMTLSQSFLVVIDTPKISYSSIPIRHSSLPGMFTAYQDPSYPLIVNYGKVAEYWKTMEDGVWSVTVQDSFLRNHVYNEQASAVGQFVTDNMLPNVPYYHSRGFLLQVFGYKPSST